MVLFGFSAVYSAAFSSDGARIVTASADKTARLWNVGTIPMGNLFEIACAELSDHDLSDIAKDYGLTNLEPICRIPRRRPIDWRNNAQRIWDASTDAFVIARYDNLRARR